MSGKSSHEINMLHGPILGPVLMFVIPSAVTSALQLIFHAADVVVVGRYAGASALAAVGASTAVINLLVNIFAFGISAGINVILAREYAAGNFDLVSRALHTAMSLALLMGFGFCGNSMDKLDSKSARIILPRVDDCISMMLGSVKRRLAIQSEKGTYFMTKGWLDGERNMYVEYKYTIDKYGEEMGEEIFDMMFGNYKRIGILDTKCYDMQPVEAETSRIAKLLKLEWEVFEASAAYLQKLVSGSWDPKLFLDIAPGTVLQLSDLRMMDED